MRSGPVLLNAECNIFVHFQLCASPLCPFDRPPSPKIVGNQCGACSPTANAPPTAAHATVTQKGTIALKKGGGVPNWRICVHRFFFSAKDHPQGPPLGTTNRQPPTATNRQPPPTTNRQPPPTANRQPPPTMVEHMSYTWSFYKTAVSEHWFFLFLMDRPGWTPISGAQIGGFLSPGQQCPP